MGPYKCICCALSWAWCVYMHHGRWFAFLNGASFSILWTHLDPVRDGLVALSLGTGGGEFANVSPFRRVADN
jgi:hypothetical protein